MSVCVSVRERESVYVYVHARVSEFCSIVPSALVK